MGTWSWNISADTHERDAHLNAMLGQTAIATTQPFAEFLSHIHRDDRETVSAAFDQSLRHGRPLSVEFRVVWPDGSIRWLRDQGDVFGTTERPRITGVCVDITGLKKAEDVLQKANDVLEGRVAERTAALEAEIARRSHLIRLMASVQEDERRRVSRELHDSVGQLLAGLSLALKTVQTSGDLPPPIAAKLGEAQQLADNLGKEVHGLAVRLRPTSLDDLGLEAALGQLIAEWSARAGIRADFQPVGIADGRLPPDIETTLYRVIQEALTNVSKHARANQVSIVVTRPDGSVAAAVEDDGIGFDPNSVEAGRLGLLGMRERVALMGGELALESAPNEGTTVVVRIPVPINA